MSAGRSRVPPDVALPKIEIHLTEACNNRCGFCTTGWLNGEGSEAVRSHVPREVIYTQLEAGLRDGKRRVLFQGGEPTLRKDLRDLVDDARALGYEATTVFTNARGAASDAGLRALVDLGVTWFQVSIQGGNAAAHDAAVGVKAFSQTVAGTRRMIDAGQRVKINAVMTRHLLDSIEDFARLMIELRPEEIGLDTVKPTSAIAPGRARYADLVPSFPPYATRLVDALQAMDRAGLVVGLTAFARCLAPGTEHFVTEEALSTQTLTTEGRAIDKGEWKRGMQVKAPGCATCRYDRVCGGVYHAYADAYGLDQLRPYAAEIELPRSSERPLTKAFRALFAHASSDRFGVREIREEGLEHAVRCFGPTGEFEVRIAPRDAQPAFANTKHFSVRYRSPPSGDVDLRVLDAIVRALGRHEPELARFIEWEPPARSA